MILPSKAASIFLCIAVVSGTGDASNAEATINSTDQRRRLFANGLRAKKDDFPWYTVLTADDQQFIDAGCAGVLVAPDYFLFPSYAENQCGAWDFEGDKQLTARVGLLCADLQDEDNCGQDFEDVIVDSVVSMEGCCDDYHKLGLYKLTKPVTSIRPVVPDDGTGFILASGGTAKAMLVGMGNFKENPPNSVFQLQKRQTQLVDMYQCELQWNFTDVVFGGFDFIGPPESLLCIDNSINGGLCHGDSGASLVLPAGASNGDDLLIGYGSDPNRDSSCTSTTHKPDVLIRIGFIFDWIRDTVCAGSLDPPFWCNAKTSAVAECTESPKTTFSSLEEKSCRWLQKLSKTSPEMVADICANEISTAAMVCPQTCALCSS